MIKQAPSPLRVALLIAFVLSCVVVLAYLWVDFGGTLPLEAQGYRVQVAFQQANELATGADVRIAGVNVGTVVGLHLDPLDNRTLATLQLDHQYAPIPRDTSATLRIKTLLGETYVQLSYGNRKSGELPDGGRIPDGQVSPDVDLDQILSTFDPKTRKAFQTWVESQAGAVQGRGSDINASFGDLPGFFDSGQKLLATLNNQSSQLSKLVANTGTFFRAISARKGQLAGLITSADNLFQTTAQRDQQLAAVFKALPEFEHQSDLTLPALTAFGDNSDPVIRALEPVASELSQTFAYTKELSPNFKSLLTRLGPTVTASKKGLPALDTILNQIPPLLSAFQPFLQNANPMVSYIGLYKQEITSFFANVTAATQGSDHEAPRAVGQSIHYLRASQTLSPLGLATYPSPIGSDRDDAYKLPGAYNQLAKGLNVLDSSECSNGNPSLSASTTPAGLAQLIQEYVYRSTNNDVAVPPCTQAGKIPGFSTSFPQLTAEAPPSGGGS
jgi:virulence factor Mce-like protein